MAHDDTPAGFLSRWSRRKVDVREGRPLEEPKPKPVPSIAGGSLPAITPNQVPSAGAAVVPAAHAADQAASGTTASEPADEQAAQPTPTLADAQQLTSESDFTGFMARGVAPDVKNAAMKKLFADPHFNVMDRMDIYIDDYSQPDPLPMAMLRQMTSAKTFNLFDDEVQETQKPLDADTQPVADTSLTDTATPPTPQDSEAPEAGLS